MNVIFCLIVFLTTNYVYCPLFGKVGTIDSDNFKDMHTSSEGLSETKCYLCTSLRRNYLFRGGKF